MKNNKWLIVFIIFLGIISIGLFRVNTISTNEIMMGTPTMTSSFTFIVYLFIAILVSIIYLIILMINSVSENILNRVIKNIFIISLL
ncbi:hypothetical protein H9660_15930, partial [Clostridium sp. Sa3CUN1]